MRQRFVIALGLCVLAALCFFWWRPPVENIQPAPSRAENPGEPAHVPGTEAVHSRPGDRETEQPTTSAVAERTLFSEQSEARIAKSQASWPRSEALDAYGAPNTSVVHDLQLVHALLVDYELLFKRGQLPVGTNEEIIRVLLGDNSQFFPFIPEDHAAINEKGALTDRYGTPLFFHALSADRMELRSAGPDRDFYTADDIVYPEPEEYSDARTGI